MRILPAQSQRTFVCYNAHRKLSHFKTPLKSTSSSEVNSQKEIQTIHKSTTEDIIAKSIAELAKISNNVEDIPEVESDGTPTPSPKVSVGIRDTWGTFLYSYPYIGTNETDTSYAKELMNDFAKLELNYKLKENWLDLNEEIERPFEAEFSIIMSNDKQVFIFQESEEQSLIIFN